MHSAKLFLFVLISLIGYSDAYEEQINIREKRVLVLKRNKSNLKFLSDLNKCFSNSSHSEDYTKIKIVNQTSMELAVSVNYLNENDDWITNHVIVSPKDYEYCCSTDNDFVYYYAVDTYGYGREVSGSSIVEKNYYGTSVGFVEHDFDGSEIPTITIYE